MINISMIGYNLVLTLKGNNENNNEDSNDGLGSKFICRMYKC